MSDRDSTRDTPARARHRVRARRGGAHGATGAAQLAKLLGNQAVEALLREASGQRDALGVALAAQLGWMEAAQAAERDAITGPRGLTAELLDRPGVARRLPDPQRWAAPATTARRAAEALGRGDLARARALLARLAEEVEARRGEVPSALLLGSAPPALPEVPATRWDAAPPVPVRPLLDRADRLRDAVGGRPRLDTFQEHLAEGAWWEEEEEEEEEETGDGAPAVPPGRRRG